MIFHSPEVYRSGPKSMNEEKVFSREWLGRTLTIKTGKMAWQADASVTVQYGDTVILATAVEDKENAEDKGFFPLMVELEERLYAAGVIKGSQWIKREGRPADETVLTRRMIDRSIRPLFDQTSTRAVQVTNMVVSVDQANDHDIVALVASSAVLALSPINWNGPIAGVRVGRVEGKLIFNPTYEEREKSDLDLIVAGTSDKTIMIEAGANEVSEADMINAINEGQKQLLPAIELIRELQKAFNIKKTFVAKAERAALPDDEQSALEVAKEWLNKNIPEILFDKAHYKKNERKAAVHVIKENLLAWLQEKKIEPEIINKVIKILVEEMVEAEVTRAILSEGKRVDGRQLNETRTILSEVALLPRPHGSGLFSRGETQVMSVVTLGSPGDKQSLESLEGRSDKNYIHHYYFPSFATGEARPNRGGAGPREIGHGALAEKALMPVLPAKADFPYTIRVVSETLGSNGSSSMASTCGSSLALMDAGVPIKKAVAGVAMGLASNEDMSQWKVLTDIQDLEDGEGGMDFKITGTADGITAIQMDTKTYGITEDIIKQTINQCCEARLQILETMNKAIAEPRAELSQYAPRITSFYINPARIREVIGTGGKIINEIISECGVSIDIDDDGLVVVCGIDANQSARAVAWIKDIVREFKAGEIFTGKVVKLLDFGAFVSLPGGKDGMVHVSELAPYRISSPDKFVKIGDEVTVKIKEIDDQGRINLTMKGLEANEALWKDKRGEETGNTGFGGPRQDRGPRDGNRGGFQRR
jgi:polyribonucleotide nucleotidyltransferase